MLEVRELTFGYHRGEEVLSRVDLDVGIGRTVLLGPNGAGKSTLLRVLAGVHRFSGEIALDGERMRQSRPSRAYRTAVGWLPQEVHAFGGLTAREHVAYVGWLKGMSRSVAWERSLRSLRDVGLDDRADERANQLSGGQTRRLGIAAALVHDARCLLLDEPTAGLDPRERDRLMEVLAPIEERRAVLISTHDTDAEVFAGADVAVLVGGTMRFGGSVGAFIDADDSLSESQRIRRAYASYVPED